MPDNRETLDAESVEDLRIARRHLLAAELLLHRFPNEPSLIEGHISRAWEHLSRLIVVAPTLREEIESGYQSIHQKPPTQTDKGLAGDSHAFRSAEQIERLRKVIGRIKVNHRSSRWFVVALAIAVLLSIAGILWWRFAPSGSHTYRILVWNQGWGTLQRDRSVSGGMLRLDGGSCLGLGTHAPSVVTLTLPHRPTMFSGRCGLDDVGRANGTIRCKILQNGTVLWESSHLTELRATDEFVVALSGSEVTLVVDDMNDGSDYDHANWCDLQFHPL